MKLTSIDFFFNSGKSGMFVCVCAESKFWIAGKTGTNAVAIYIINRNTFLHQVDTNNYCGVGVCANVINTYQVLYKKSDHLKAHFII